VVLKIEKSNIMAKTKTKSKKGTPEMSVFVIMCFDKNLTIVYEKVIKFVFQLHNFRCVRGDEIYRDGNIVEQIKNEIQDCDLVLCDLTYNNPNVFFELGIAHSLNKRIIHITQEPANIPFDVKTTRTIPYTDTKTGLLDLRDDLSKFVNEMFPKKQDYSIGNSDIKYIVTENKIQEQRFYLLSEETHLRHFAVKFLGDCADSESFNTIEWIAGTEKNCAIVQDAFWALYKIDAQNARDFLISKGLRWQEEFLVRETVVDILGYYKADQYLIDQLLLQINDSSWGVRKTVCDVFGKWRIIDNSISAKLRTMLHDKEPMVRLAAKNALEKISSGGKKLEKHEEPKTDENSEVPRATKPLIK
jgi:nucleoside 2-deoxyribosyltransferase